VSDDERCAEFEAYVRIDTAIREGDLPALRAALGNPDDFPNVVAPMSIGNLLAYAIYHGPLRFIRELIEAGADVNYDDHEGFPSLIAALSAEPQPGYPGRRDRLEVVQLLLASGADVNQRGLNDYTPLHWAAGQGDVRIVEVLLAHGADMEARTRIDDFESPLEIAEQANHADVVALLLDAPASGSSEPRKG
jgi:ankyrin repeat protein